MRDILAFQDIGSGEAWRGAVAEFIATFLFVFIGAGSVVSVGIFSGGEHLTAGALVAIAIGHGLAIAAMVAATGHISGGHLNPAVTIAAAWAGRIGLTRAAMFVALQLAGAALAALLLKAVIPDAQEGGLGAHALGDGITVGAGFAIEAVLTFTLVFAVFATAIDPKGPAHLAPFAIGTVVLIAHLVAVPLTGASINPARTFGPALAMEQWADHWVYWAGPLAGGVLAAIVYKLFFLARVESDY